MALRPLRHIHETTMNFVLDRVAEPGLVVVASGTAGKVDVVGAVQIAASGIYPVGLVLNFREDINYAKEYTRYSYDTDDIGTVVSLLRDGEVTTNLVVQNGGTIVPGTAAYLAPNGRVGNANLAVSGADQRVGQFLSAVDTDGYVVLRVDLN